MAGRELQKIGMLWMANFTRTDLKLQYSWDTAEEIARTLSGFPRNVIFNSNEGYEMLYFVNKYMEVIGWQTIVSFNNIEVMLRHRLPSGIRSHHHVKLWLDSCLTR